MTTPISWIRLERYHLGEGVPEERARIEAALAECETTRARLDEIRQDTAPMPELPAVLPERRRWWPAATGLALAAALALLAIVTPPVVNTKGGDLALTLVRERSGKVTPAPADFQDGDRFSIRLTCPAGEPMVTVRIKQGGEIFAPYPTQPLACGNQVPLPGAFSVSGPDDITVCVDLDGVEICEAIAAVE